MTVFVDTSALYALLDAADQNHGPARAALEDLLARDEDLVCTNYILVETTALLQRRLGLKAVRDFKGALLQALRVLWVESGDHDASLGALLLANRRQFSLVDCVSFDAMRRHGIAAAFAFDRHFEDQGFERIP
jgi:predicted nucleic acid-binding protein